MSVKLVSRSAKAALALLAIASAVRPVAAQPAASPFTTGYRYDVAGRQVGIIQPDDGVGPVAYPAQRITYGAKGLPTRVEHGSLAVWHGTDVPPSAWTGFSVTRRVDFSYDALGRKIQERAVEGTTAKTLTEYAYDSFDRLSCAAVRMNESDFASAPVDGCTHRAAGADGPDRITRTSYDNRDRVTQIEKAVGTGLAQVYAAYTYNAGDRPLSVVDANGNRAEMTYDGFERQKRWIFPLKTSSPPAPVNPDDYEEYGYDANGNRTSLRKRDGVTLGFQYDGLGRMTVKTVPASVTGAAGYSVFYGYDLRGLQTFARFGSVSGAGVTNGYDGFGRLTSSATNMDGTSRTFNSQYDSDGNRILLSSPSNYHAAFAYDGLDRMSAYKEGATTVVGFEYDSAGRRSAVRFGAGATSSVSYGYDGIGRLKSLDRALAGTAADEADFTHNPASQMATRSSTSSAYASNSARNVARSYAVNGLNQYTGAGEATFDYDANGNLKSVANVPEGSTSYVYDSENRLVSASGGWNATLSYDPLGRLWQVSAGAGSTTRFIYDGDRPVEEYDGAGNRLRIYVHGAGANEPLVWYEWAGGPVHRFYHADHQGSIVALADDYGNALGINGYDPWGIPNSGNMGRFQYTGQSWLAELGMYYYKARIYSPTLGRFLQTDPIGYGDQVNLYAYAGNDPVSHVDPNGKQTVLVTFYEKKFGIKLADHSGLYVARSEMGPAIYDPGGSYAPPDEYGARYHPTGDLLTGRQANLDRYVNEARKDGYYVRLTTLNTSESEERGLFAGMDEQGGRSPGLCTIACSTLLRDIPGLKGIGSYLFPDHLADSVAKNPRTISDVMIRPNGTQYDLKPKAREEQSFCHRSDGHCGVPQ